MQPSPARTLPAWAIGLRATLWRAETLAVLLALAAVLVSYWVTVNIYEGVPHIEDEIAYVWQARLIASGAATMPSPPEPASFLVPFVIDLDGLRFGKYPLGWPTVLALGELSGLRAWINPLLAGLGVWFTYVLGRRIAGQAVGLLSAALLIPSPFLLLNSGSLLSHVWGWLLTAAFTLFWLDLFGPPSATEPDRKPPFWLRLLTLALTIGTLFISRPFTAVAIAIPFALHAIYLLLRGPNLIRRALIAFGLIALLVSGLQVLWQFHTTGDPFQDLYTLWWDYDRIGFGEGVGLIEGGHTLRQGWINSRFNLRIGAVDLFGWAQYSWILAPLGLLALRRKPGAWLSLGSAVSLFGLHLGYWVGGWLFGPRYYFEGLSAAALLTAAGIAWLAGWPLTPGAPLPRRTDWQRWRAPLALGAVSVLVVINLVFYLPQRLDFMTDLYGIGREDLAPFLDESNTLQTPALIFVDAPRWMNYGALLELQDPYLTSEYIFAYQRGPNSQATLLAAFPERSAYLYAPAVDAWQFQVIRELAE